MPDASLIIRLQTARIMVMLKFNHARILLQLIFLAISLQPSSSKVCKKQQMQFCDFDGVGQTVQTPLTNLLGQSSQRQIALDKRFRALQLLHETGCSELVKPFTCSIFAPVCLEDLGLLPPCKSLCEKVKSSCDGFVALARRKPRGKLDINIFLQSFL